jgi:hypothetical protein
MPAADGLSEVPMSHKPPQADEAAINQPDTELQADWPGADQPESDPPADLPEIEFQSPGRFPIHNPSAHRSPETRCEPAPFELGVESALQRFTSPEQARAHALALIGQARRSLCIYSLDLEPWLYHQAAIQEACTRFLLASPNNRLRILLADSTRAVKEGHRLLNLARRLPSNCQIRKLNPDHAHEQETFLLADRHGLLLRPKPELQDGVVLYNDVGRVKLRQAQFDQAWEQSISDPDLRSQLI